MFEPATLPQLAERFSAFLVDQFGVLLDGAGAYPCAADALTRLSETGKPVTLLSNSGKRGYLNEARLVEYGFERDSFRDVLSSGEAAHREIHRRLGNALADDAEVFVVSRDGDASFLEETSLQITTKPEEADLIILAGSEAEKTSLDEYKKLLSAAAALNIPCWCTNPDKQMLMGDRMLFGAGAIAQTYEAMGGRVEWFGKPYALIYERALADFRPLFPKDVLCIGDSPEHDIAGGAGAGCGTALVRTGIHADESDDELRATCERYGAIPDFILHRFEW